MIITLVFVGVGLALVSKKSYVLSDNLQDNFVPDYEGDFSGDFTNSEQTGDDRIFNDGTNLNQPRDANHPLARLIMNHESNGAYNVVFGGRKFSDYSAHPFDDGGEFKRAGIKASTITVGVNKGLVSTAAGRYQILLKTWRGIRVRLQLPDFSPTSQDAAMVALIPTNAWTKYNNGDIAGAIQLLGPIWTSLPGSPTGENRISLNDAVQEVLSYA
jgi:muramidase (phage lysozyme)